MLEVRISTCDSQSIGTFQWETSEAELTKSGGCLCNRGQEATWRQALSDLREELEVPCGARRGVTGAGGTASAEAPRETCPRGGQGTTSG